MKVKADEEILYNGILYRPDSTGHAEVPEEVAIAYGFIPPPASAPNNPTASGENDDDKKGKPTTK
jgi:phenylalanyl-tRNA synthetase beta subunit